MLVNQVNSRL